MKHTTAHQPAFFQILLLALAVGLTFGTPAFAQSGGTSTPDYFREVPLKGGARQKAVLAVENYLNDLQAFAAHFEQTVAGSHPSTGTFYFKKPGKFLWHYLKPDPAKLVSSGGTIYFHDETSNQTTQVPRKGLADLLTRKSIDLNEGNFAVDDVFTKGGLLYLTVRVKDVSEGDIGGQLQLTFLQDPMQLRQITTINQMNQPVEVLFYNIRENKPIPDDVFDFTPFHYREK